VCNAKYILWSYCIFCDYCNGEAVKYLRNAVCENAIGCREKRRLEGLKANGNISRNEEKRNVYKWNKSLEKCQRRNLKSEATYLKSGVWREATKYRKMKPAVRCGYFHYDWCIQWPVLCRGSYGDPNEQCLCLLFIVAVTQSMSSLRNIVPAFDVTITLFSVPLWLPLPLMPPYRHCSLLGGQALLLMMPREEAQVCYGDTVVAVEVMVWGGTDLTLLLYCRLISTYILPDDCDGGPG